jgi:hypothetical protein
MAILKVWYPGILNVVSELNNVGYTSILFPFPGVCPVASQTDVNKRDFLCNDKKCCINGGLKCNGIANCQDSSDEGFSMCNSRSK